MQGMLMIINAWVASGGLACIGYVSMLFTIVVTSGLLRGSNHSRNTFVYP